MGEIRQILEKKRFYLFSKVILAVSKVKHLPHLPPLRYGHVEAIYYSTHSIFFSIKSIPKTNLYSTMFVLIETSIDFYSNMLYVDLRSLKMSNTSTISTSRVEPVKLV